MFYLNINETLIPGKCFLFLFVKIINKTKVSKKITDVWKVHMCENETAYTSREIRATIF